MVSRMGNPNPGPDGVMKAGEATVY